MVKLGKINHFDEYRTEIECPLCYLKPNKNGIKDGDDIICENCETKYQVWISYSTTYGYKTTDKIKGDI